MIYWLQLLDTIQLPCIPEVSHLIFDLDQMARLGTVWLRIGSVLVRRERYSLLSFYWVIFLQLCYLVAGNYILIIYCSGMCITIALEIVRLLYWIFEHFLLRSIPGFQFYLFEHHTHQVILFRDACMWYFKVFRAILANSSLTFDDLRWTQFLHDSFWKLLCLL